ncbi:MAG TPA: response regulator transcription factor [Thermosulfurimonas dismutans]|uniref:Response regulator transcription factor n=1 Tax=Thermosulfurimonas dismutans TaxID=999894 RepID=A0A7C3H1M6_9BACT|nr:response regulator transcription factor [Thermosulfurimonas dismutans]
MSAWNRPSVLLIEDDPLLGPSLEEYLQRQGFEAHWLSDERYWREALSREFDLVVLDLMLPHLPGELLLAELRKEYPDLPVLILTAKQGLDSKKECFELGADDYLVKPFEVLELELRIRALLRRKGKDRKEYRLGEVRIDLERGMIIKGKERIVPSRRTWDLLLFFLKNRGKVIPKEKILEEVWRDVIVNEETLRSYIKELRRLLPQGALQTFKGRGYLLKEEP